MGRTLGKSDTSANFTQGFLIPYTSTILTLCQFDGAVPPYTLIGLSGDYYFLGAIAMNIAGICEFILGNSKCKPVSSRSKLDGHADRHCQPSRSWSS